MRGEAAHPEPLSSAFPTDPACRCWQGPRGLPCSPSFRGGPGGFWRGPEAVGCFAANWRVPALCSSRRTEPQGELWGWVVAGRAGVSGCSHERWWPWWQLCARTARGMRSDPLGVRRPRAAWAQHGAPLSWGARWAHAALLSAEDGHMPQTRRHTRAHKDHVHNTPCMCTSAHTDGTRVHT